MRWSSQFERTNLWEFVTHALSLSLSLSLSLTSTFHQAIVCSHICWETEEKHTHTHTIAHSNAYTVDEYTTSFSISVRCELCIETWEFCMEILLANWKKKQQHRMRTLLRVYVRVAMRKVTQLRMNPLNCSMLPATGENGLLSFVHAWKCYRRFHRHWRKRERDHDSLPIFKSVLHFSCVPTHGIFSLRMLKLYRVDQFNGAETIWFGKCQFYCTMARKMVNLLVEL